jgi:cytochrome c556
MDSFVLKAPMKKLVIALAAACAAPHALAQFAKAEDAVRYRQAAFTVLAQHFRSLGDMANGKAAFNAQTAADDANVLAAVSALPYAAFGPGTDQGAGTKANPLIWQKSAEFNRHAEQSQADIAKLVAAARSGSADALKSATPSVARSCKACHDSFKDSGAD